MRPATREWIVDVLIGGISGGVAGAIVAVNVVITAGIDAGYEATPIDVFRENALVGVVTMVILVGGPVLGVVLARRLRR